MRPIFKFSGPPSGYVLESATVAYSGKRAFTVNREAQCEYGPGTPLLLIQQGKLVPAVVQTYTYDGVRMTITVNVDVDTSIIGVYRDDSAPFIYGCDHNLSLLYHCESENLYDSGRGAIDQGSTGMILYGNPLVSAAVNPKFGTKCLQAAAATTFSKYGASPLATSSWMPMGALGSGLWCFEGWFYGLPSGHIYSWRDNWYWGNSKDGIISFNAGYPVIYYQETYSNSNSVSFSLQNTAPCHANQWNHVVWCHDATGYFRTAVNGVFGSSGLCPNLTVGGHTLLGVVSGSTSGEMEHIVSLTGSFAGIFDELRITAGFCPYQGGYNFTPPTKPFGPDFR